MKQAKTYTTEEIFNALITRPFMDWYKGDLDEYIEWSNGDRKKLIKDLAKLLDQSN